MLNFIRKLLSKLYRKLGISADLGYIGTGVSLPPPLSKEEELRLTLDDLRLEGQDIDIVDLLPLDLHDTPTVDQQIGIGLEKIVEIFVELKRQGELSVRNRRGRDRHLVRVRRLGIRPLRRPGHQVHPDGRLRVEVGEVDVFPLPGGHHQIRGH